MKKPETLHCLVRALNFSPKGGVEGLQVEVDSKFAQVVFPHETGTNVARTITLGSTIDLLVEIEPHSRSAESLHTVYQYISMKSSEASVTLTASTSSVVAGVVARLNYARHGEPNGVVLDSGDFIHLKPHGMRQFELDIGDHIEADGKVRDMELGGRVIEATSINGVALKGKH